MIGFKYDGRHSDTLGVLMTAKRVPLVPPLSENFEEIPGKDGVWDFGVQYGARPIEIDCSMIGGDVTDLKAKLRSLAGFFNPRLGARPLIFDDEPDKQYFARLTGQLPLEQIGALGSFTLQLTCPDPFLYSVEEAVASGATVYAINNGTYYAQPILKITHNGGVGTLVVNRTDGKTQTLTFKSDAPSGLYEVNCKEGTIVRSGAGAYQYLSGDFFQLPEGSNTITKTGGVGSVEVRFRHTWV